VLALATSDQVLPQIVPDGTLGAEESLVTPDVNINGGLADRIDGGATRGGNLFHSFEQFNIGNGQRVYFANPIGIENIFSRVTGTDPSDILGTLGVNGGANLFFLNPNGIIFGENAVLDVRGSFVGSTASSIQFEDGTAFSAANPDTPPLLTISVPIGLQYQGTEGDIVVRAGSPAAGEFQVQPGQTLALVGGQVSLEGATVKAPGGQVEMGGLTAPGTVRFNFDPDTGSLGSLTFPSEVKWADVEIVDSASSGTQIDVSGAGGGSITINARNLQILGTTAPNYLDAGIAAGQGFPGAVAGDITLNTTESITVGASEISNIVNGTGDAGNVNIMTGTLSLSNFAGLGSLVIGQGNAGNVVIIADTITLDQGSIGSLVFPTGVGNAGNVTINAGTVSLINGGQVNSATFGKGNAGSVIITADMVSLDGEGVYRTGITSQVQDGAEENGGSVIINAGTLSLTNGARVSGNTFGQGNAGSVMITADAVSFDGFLSGVVSQVQTEAEGNAGNVTINTGTLSLTNSAQVSSSTFGKGDASNVTVTANTISLDNSSVASTSVEPGAEGNAGHLTITAETLSLTNGSQASSSTFAKGDAGNVRITADTVFLDGEGSNGFNSAVGSSVEPGAEGNGGTIAITARTLSLTNGAQVSGATWGQGNAGSMTITADTVFLDGEDSDGFNSGIASQVQRGAVGKGGEITINARTLSVTNGTGVGSSTFGQGDAGNVRITADAVSLNGEAKDGNFSLVSSLVEAEAEGNGGNVTINARTLSLINGGAISVDTRGEGNAGTIEINTNIIEAAKGGLIVSDTLTSGRAGTILIQASESFTFSGADTGVFADTQAGSTGAGGSIELDSPNITLSDGAAIVLNSQGTGKGGDLILRGDSLTLDNQASLSAETANSTGGNITLSLDNLLLMRRESRISTTAGTAQASGDGGNITIDAGVIAAIPDDNNDITANAFSGQGGRVTLTTQGLYNFVIRSHEEIQALLGTDDLSEFDTSQLQTNDITAISQTSPTLSRIPTLNLQGIDPTGGLIELPDLVDVTRLVEQNLCAASVGSEFTITGRGGLPTPPHEPLIAEATWEDWRIDSESESNEAIPSSPVSRDSQRTTEKRPKAIVEAQGWYRDAQGNVILTANPTTVTPHGTWLSSYNCQ
jgi:filamentous hemagglutinin family protein